MAADVGVKAALEWKRKKLQYLVLHYLLDLIDLVDGSVTVCVFM
jgi:hypothetical protein